MVNLLHVMLHFTTVQSPNKTLHGTAKARGLCTMKHKALDCIKQHLLMPLSRERWRYTPKALLR